MKRLVLIALVLVAALAPVTAQSIGGGLSFWLPESLYRAHDGSVGVESALETSVGLGQYLSFPIGLSYNQVYALQVEGPGISASAAPWFYADSLVLHLMGKLHVGVGPVYIDAFGGGAAGVNFGGLKPLTTNIERTIASAGEYWTFTGGPTIDGGGFGYGWVAGGGIGMTFGQISVDINATYRLLRYAVSVSGDYVSTDGTTLLDSNTYTSATGLKARLGGFSVGVNGSFAM